MSLNLNPIRHISRISGMRIGCLILFLIIFCSLSGYAQIKNEEEIKKQADKHFIEEDYNLAYKLYAELVSYYPKDPEFNFRLGVCMIYSEPDKKKSFFFLNMAAKAKEAPKDLKFYLGKAYHINYQFDEALKLYSEYKLIGTSTSIKKLQVDREIEACKNGKRLLSNISDLIVINKKQLNEADYFRSYDLKDIGGKLLVKPDEFRTSIDKKKKEKSVIYLPRNGQRIYYSSYGENGNKGRDIFFVNQLPNGSWSKPQAMPATINTDYDEDYPFLHPNGKTLYFSSKGHNSMGGFDIFKTTFDDETQSWSKPLNLDFPVNSPDDDILFVTDSLEKTAFFSTGRYSPSGKIDVLKINTERRPMNFAVIKGTVLKEEVSQSLKAKITVKNIENGEIVGTYLAEENGDYNMEIPNGGKFIFTVEMPGLTTQSEGVNIPIAYSLKPYKQVISYDKKILKIINYFDGQIADENYSMMLALIEKKAKLEMNENEPINNGIKEAVKIGDNKSTNLNAVNTSNPTINANSNKNITNEQLLEMSKTDAKEATDEAVQLKKEAADAFGLATQKTAEAIDIQKEADAVLANANTITDITKKNEELSKANALKEDAITATNVANMATNLAKKLEVDANLQQKEADLTNQYVKEIEAVTKNKNNKEALVKLEKIQKELSVISTQKNQSDELLSSLKAESELKQTELNKSETKSTAINTDINIINTEVKGLEKDLVNESDNGIKENIKAQIKELNNEIEIKNKELETNNQKISTLKNEVGSVNKELQIAAKILNEKTDVVASNNSSIDPTEGAIITNTVNSSTSSTTEISVNTIVSNSTNTIVSNSTNKVSELNNTNAITSNTIANNSNENIKALNKIDANYTTANSKLNEATELENKSNLLRKEASTKTGTEKENLLKQASDNARLATTKKVEASEITQKESKVIYENNTNEIIELKKITGTKTNSEITQATKLLDEATVNFNQAQKIRDEANANTNIAAKLGGLSNAEEKEKEALLKQQKGLAILIKENPNYKTKTEEVTSTKIDSTNLNGGVLAKRQQLKIDELLNQSKTNQAELESKGNQLTSQPDYNNPTNKSAQDLKLKSDGLKNDASDIVMLQASMTKLSEKLTLLEEVNTKEKEALRLLFESNDILTKNKNAIVSSTVSAIKENTVVTETVAAVNTNTTPAVKGNTVVTETVAINANTINPTKENTVTTETLVAIETKTLNSIETATTPTNESKEITSNNSISTSTNSNTIEEAKLQVPINTLLSEADKLNNDAAVLRKSANSKTGPEKDKDLNDAKTLEAQSISKKVEAATKQQQLNTALFTANKQSLEELSEMAKGKNISELSSVNIQLTDADALLKQANNLRTESNNSTNNAAKLGGYSNAEEKESLALQKQKAVLEVYKKYFSNYVIKQPNILVNNSNVTNNTIDSKAQQSIDSLDLLVDVNNELYKSLFLKLSSTLNPTQATLKSKAQVSYKKKQELTFKASQTKDLEIKKTTLIEANLNVKNAINLLKQISETTVLATNNATTQAKTNDTPIKVVALKTEELVVANSNAYTNTKPIPIDEKMPDGLVYKVQIGAFRSALPNNTFKGLSPIVGQTTPSGLIRYMAGNFGKIENANAVKNDLNKLGYTDAFVVAYYNGVRVNLNEVLKNAKSAGENVAEATNTDTSAGLTKNTSIARNNQAVNNTSTNNVANTVINTQAVVTSELEKMNGLLYTVQIGVYSKQTTSSQLFNLKPIYTEQLPSGLYRYTAGIYNQADLIVGDKRKVVDLGVKDAFITAYYNSKRIAFTDGKKLQLENSNLKMETQNPIIFSESNNVATINNTPVNVTTTANNSVVAEIPTNTSTLNVTAFSNGVTSTPIPTAENGVKTDDVGISFKVQVGAYRYQVPNDVAAKFLSIKNWPVNNLVINGLYIYTFGNFNAASFAKKLRDEAVGLGITDAFVTVYKDGKKLYGAEAIQYLNR